MIDGCMLSVSVSLWYGSLGRIEHLWHLGRWEGISIVHTAYSLLLEHLDVFFTRFGQCTR